MKRKYSWILFAGTVLSMSTAMASEVGVLSYRVLAERDQKCQEALNSIGSNALPELRDLSADAFDKSAILEAREIAAGYVFAAALIGKFNFPIAALGSALWADARMKKEDAKDLSRCIEKAEERYARNHPFWAFADHRTKGLTVPEGPSGEQLGGEWATSSGQ